jgi:hypothetical protein
MTRPIFILVALVLAGCATAPPPRVVVPDRPALDSELTKPCKVPPATEAELSTFDGRDGYLMHKVLPALVRCAQRHAGVVEACMRPGLEK